MRKQCVPGLSSGGGGGGPGDEATVRGDGGVAGEGRVVGIPRSL